MAAVCLFFSGPAYASPVEGSAASVEEVEELPAEDRVITLSDKTTEEEAALALPDTWNVTLSDGTETEASVTWDCMDDFDDDEYTSYVFRGRIEDDDISPVLDPRDKEKLTMEIFFEGEIRTEDTGDSSEIPVYEGVLSPNTIIPDVEGEQGTGEISGDFTEDFGDDADEVIEVIQSNKMDNSVLSDLATDTFRKISPDTDSYLYSRLSDEEQAFYNEIDKWVTNYLYYGMELTSINDVSVTAYITAEDLTPDEATNVRAYYFANNPQAFFLSNMFYRTVKGGKVMISMAAYPDADTPEEIKDKAEQIAVRLDSAVSDLDSTDSEYSISKALYDDLCGYVDYDQEAVGRGTEGSSNWASWGPGWLSYDQSILSVFAGNGHTVCAGYSKAYTSLMRMAGLDAFSITSSAHEWNKARVDGKWYGVDTTWADQSSIISYNYLLKSDETLKKYGAASAHTWESRWKGKAPETAEDYVVTSKTEEYADICISHNWVTKEVNKKATLKEDGLITLTCSECGASYVDAIHHPETFRLSEAKYVYNGSAKKPKVKVTDSSGKVIPSSDYTLSYSSNKKVGTASVSVKFKGNYSGTKKLTFKIVPGSASIRSVKAKTGGFTVRWQKRTAQTDGYQLQYSTDPDFNSGKKTITINNARTVSRTVTDLRAGKKYYVRIRTYRKVNGKAYYSSWSERRTVTTK